MRSYATVCERVEPPGLGRVAIAYANFRVAEEQPLKTKVFAIAEHRICDRVAAIPCGNGTSPWRSPDRKRDPTQGWGVRVRFYRTLLPPLRSSEFRPGSNPPRSMSRHTRVRITCSVAFPPGMWALPSYACAHRLAQARVAGLMGQGWGPLSHPLWTRKSGAPRRERHTALWVVGTRAKTTWRG